MPRKGGVPENLKPCKPGETHNPNGRPKGVIALMEAGTSPDEMIASIKKAQAMAKSGNLKALELLLDRLYGKATQAVEHSGEVNTTVTFKIIE